MKIVGMCVLALAILGLASSAHAQAGGEINAQLHPLLKRVIQSPQAPIPDLLKSHFAGRQGRDRIAGQEALHLIVRTSATRQQLEAAGVRVRTLVNGIATVTVRPAGLAALASRADVSVITLPVATEPLLNSSVPQTGVTALRSESGGVFTGQTGDGVVVGVIDSGIDFDHADFIDAAGNNRLTCLWDQTEEPAGAGTSSSYGYGTEWSSAEIASGLCTELDDDPDAFGHGTHVTGTAAGNGAAPNLAGTSYVYTGMAPNAKICFVKTDFSSDHVIDAMDYIFAQADLLGLPAVINLSLGTQMGAHDGTDPMEEAIDSYVTASTGRAVVVAAGNEADANIHAEINAVAAVSVLGPDFEIPGYVGELGDQNDFVAIAGYYPATDDLTVSLFPPGGGVYSRTLKVTPTFLDDGCTEWNTTDGYIVLCNRGVSFLGQSTGDREIFVYILDVDTSKPPAAGTWGMSLSGNTVAGSGQVDFWMVSDFGPLDETSEFVTNLDEDETLGIPASSNEAITVGAYITKVCWTDSSGTAQSYSGTYSLGDIAPFSGHGPTRDGRAKPDITAPGMGIVSSLAHEASPIISGAGYGLILLDNDHSLLQGTSMAAPHVTGAVALLFEADPTLDSGAVKDLLDDHARTDSWTTSYAEPTLLGLGTKNDVFGPGKLNLGSYFSLDTWETNDTVATSRTLLSGKVITGYLDTAADLDTFFVDALATGDTISATLSTLPDNYKLSLLSTLSIGTCGAQLTLLSASSDNAGTADENLIHTLTALSHPKYVRVATSAGAFSASSPYTLKATITRPETAAVHNSTATAQVLPDFVEFKVAGTTANVAERDYYSFTAGANETITLNAGLFRTVRLLNSAGAVLVAGVGKQTYVPGGLLLGTKTYYVQVYGTLLPSSYTLTVTQN